MPLFQNHFAINFYHKGVSKQFARRILSQVPRAGEKLVFNRTRYSVDSVEWCLDDDATNHEYQALINIEIIEA